jgi:hypothetical protein
MREMAIPPFPRKFENPDLGNLLRTRLSQKVVLWPDQAIPLAGYICHPNDPAAREELLGTLKSWSDGSETVPPHLGRIQHEWLRVADVLHHCTDLIDGQHQKKRGGPSIGKAIALVEGKAKRRGTGAANLWKRWKRYKDVAHLATAAVLICGEARTRSAGQSFGPFGLSSDQLGPFQMAMMMPDLVLAVALDFQQRGLNHIPHARTEPILNPETLWRIPEGINVAPLPPPTRTVTGADIGLLNARRAGNRGEPISTRVLLVRISRVPHPCPDCLAGVS